MKPNNRATRKDDKKAGQTQSPKTADKTPGKSGGHLPGKAPPDKISLVFVSEQGGVDLGGIDLLPGEFEVIQQAAAARNESLSAWFNRVMTGMLKDAEAKLKSTCAAAEGGPDKQSAKPENPVEQSSSAEENASDGLFPAMCEPSLEEVVRQHKLSAEQRRRLAGTYERWVAQLRLSADVMEKFGGNLSKPMEIVFPDADLQEWIKGNTPAECLKFISKMQRWCDQVRAVLGLRETPKTFLEKEIAARFTFPN